MKKREALQKEKIVDSLCLPKDICLGEIRIILSGCQEAVIENYRGIISYDDSLILLQGKRNKILIEGSRLRIDYYTNTDMKISGMLASVKYI